MEWGCDERVWKMVRMQIFDFQYIRKGKNEWNGHDDPAMMQVMVKKFDIFI